MKPRILSAVAMATCATACLHGTTMIEFDVSASISIRDSTGRVTKSSPDDFKLYPRRPPAATPFPTLEYNGEKFIWHISAGGGGFGNRIRSLASTPVCFRFDQARLTSSFHAGEVKLMLTGGWHRPANGKGIFLVSIPGQTPLYHPTPFCFGTESLDYFVLGPDLTALFPSGKMFNAQLSDKDKSLTDAGTGNWLTLKVPVEYEGKRDELEITMTAMEAKTRVSHH